MNVVQTIKSVLFSKDRKPGVAKQIEAPEEILQRNIAFKGGVIVVQKGLTVDAALSQCTIVSQEGGPIVVSPLANCVECCVKAGDVIVSGDFTGEIIAKGDVEVTDSARIIGTIKAGGNVLLSPIASEAGQIKVARYVEEPQSFKEDPAFNNTIVHVEEIDEAV